MKTILSLTLLLALADLKAQNNLVVFSENGEKFFLVINGVKQNLEAETNVKVTDLIQPNYKAKIVFEDKAKGVVDQNIYFMQGGESVKNYEFVFSVGMKKKGLYKARAVSAAAIGPQTTTSADQSVVHYTTTEPTESNNNVISDGSSPGNVNVADDGTAINNNTNLNVDQSGLNNQVQPSSGNDANVNLNVNSSGVNMNGAGMNMNVSSSGMNMNSAGTNMSMNSNSSGVNMNSDGMNMNGNVNGMNNANITTISSQTVTNTTTRTSNGTTTVNKATTVSGSGNGTTRTSSNTNSTMKSQTIATDGYENGTKANTAIASCVSGMSAADFDAAKESVNSKDFEESKLTVAKQVLDNNCMTSAQVKELMSLLTYDNSKLDFAKQAYGRTVDKNNFYKLNDAFTFESSVTELNNYIKKSGK